MKLDPSYYSFESCFCEEGYTASKQYENGVLVAIACAVPEVGGWTAWCSSSDALAQGRDFVVYTWTSLGWAAYMVVLNVNLKGPATGAAKLNSAWL